MAAGASCVRYLEFFVSASLCSYPPPFNPAPQRFYMLGTTSTVPVCAQSSDVPR